MDLGDNVLHIAGEVIPLQKKGSCSLARLKPVVRSWTQMLAYPLIRSVLHP